MAVDDITFVAQPGRVTGFLGPNGAGKTTTMRIMVGLTAGRPTGASPSAATATRDIPNPGRHVGVLLDASAQHAGRTGREVLTIGARTMGLPDSRVDEMLEPGLADPAGGQAPGAQLLARHAAAARHRARAARRPAGADPRRARQRPRPGRHPLDARAAQGVRRARRHRAALQPPAQRGRADRRRHDPDRPRPDRRPGHQAESLLQDSGTFVRAVEADQLAAALSRGRHRHAPSGDGLRSRRRGPSRSARSPPPTRSPSSSCARRRRPRGPVPPAHRRRPSATTSRKERLA